MMAQGGGNNFQVDDEIFQQKVNIFTFEILNRPITPLIKHARIHYFRKKSIVATRFENQQVRKATSSEATFPRS